MRRYLAFLLGLGLGGMLVMPHGAAAQAKPVAAPAQHEQTQPRPPLDAATRAMRPEAEASAKERERTFARIRRLEPFGVQPAARLDIQRQRANQEAAMDRFVIRAAALAPEAEEPQDNENEAEDAQNENRPALRLRQRNLIVASESFDQWIFSGDTIEDRRARLNDNLRRTIVRVDPNHRLTAVQRQKLTLAGRGDIKHFFDQVEAKRREFEQVRTDLDKCRAFARDLRPLRRAYVTGPFDDSSLFTKILKTMRPQPR